MYEIDGMGKSKSFGRGQILNPGYLIAPVWWELKNFLADH